MKITCPNCNTELDSPSIINDGDNVSCSECGHKFTHNNSAPTSRQSTTSGSAAKKAVIILLLIIVTLLAINTYYAIPKGYVYQYRYIKYSDLRMGFLAPEWAKTLPPGDRDAASYYKLDAIAPGWEYAGTLDEVKSSDTQEGGIRILVRSRR